MAFNVFEPVKLPVLITSIVNHIGPEPDSLGSTDGRHNYTIRTSWVARDGSGLRGNLSIEGTCVTNPADPSRLDIRFSGGTIKPAVGQDLTAWSNVVGKKDTSGSKAERSVTSFKTKATGLFLKLVFGFRPPADTLGSQGELSYEMKRSPKGVVDVLYLDQDMRITRGIKGALVVTTRS